MVAWFKSYETYSEKRISILPTPRLPPPPGDDSPQPICCHRRILGGGSSRARLRRGRFEQANTTWIVVSDAYSGNGPHWAVSDRRSLAAPPVLCREIAACIHGLAFHVGVQGFASGTAVAHAVHNVEMQQFVLNASPLCLVKGGACPGTSLSCMCWSRKLMYLKDSVPWRDLRFSSQ